MPREIAHQHGHTQVGGLSRVFHCNHYNAYLQMAVLLSEDVPGCQPRELLKNAVIPLVLRLKAGGYTSKDLVEEFAWCGFGKLRALLRDEWVTPHSHYGQAALMHGRKEPSCYFTVGYLAGLSGREMYENQCKQQRSPVDWFKPKGELHPPADYLQRPPKFTPVPPRFGFEGAQKFDTRIDEGAIIQAVSGLPLYGRSGINDNGLIDAFGVVLTNHFADYYNHISYQTYFGMLQGGMPKEHIRDIFVQGGHICAFNTFGGIMSSPEWYQLIAPLCRNDADWIHGMVAVINALGWGVWRVERIDPGHELIIRVYNSYEGVGFLRGHPQGREKQISFLNLGAVRGLAHLLWKIDIKRRPTLDHDFYAGVFNNPQGCFQVEQTHAIGAGDEYDRIVARRE
jgi:hypothetical protein